MANQGKSSTFDNDLLKLIFNNTAITGIADAATAGSLANLYISLHTATPDVGGNQTTNEVTVGAYNTYVRQPVARTTGGWTVSGTSVTPVAAITFPACTGGTGATIGFFAVGTAVSGTGKVLYFGTVSPTIAVANGVTPQLANTSSVTES